MKIAVFCGSKSGRDNTYLKFAKSLGEAIALQNHTLIYGGSNIGCMGALATGAVSNNGKVIGVIPKFLASRETPHNDITQLIYTETMNQRKDWIFDQADAFIALPGGYGTLDEFFEAVTLKTIGKLNKPIVLSNYNSFYDYMLDHIEDSIDDDEFSYSSYNKLFVVAYTVEETLRAIL